MRFIIFVVDIPNNPASSDEMQKIDQFNEKLQTDGNWVMAAGIKGLSAAKVIDNRSNKSEIVNSSLLNGEENYSGFWIIEAESQLRAEEIAMAGSLACNRKVELRPYIH